MIETTKYLIIAASLALAFFVQPNFVVAQDAPPLQEHQKSVALIDVRVDQLIKEALAAGVQQKVIDQIKLEGPFKDIKPSEIDRVFGAVCLPENFEQAMPMLADPRQNGLPLEFFFRVKFTDAESLERMQSVLARQLEPTTLSDGKEYMTPKDMASPFLFAHRVDKTTFEFGTKAYVLQPKRNFFTDELMQAFKSAPKESVRLVVDLETRREFLQQAAKMAKKNLDPISSAYLDLIGNAKSLVVTSSLSSENLLSMIAEANNDSDAEELAEGIEGLLGSAKVGFAVTYAQMAPLVTPEMEAPLQNIKGLVDTLAATQSGSTVKVLIKRPEGLAEDMSKLQQGMAARSKGVARMNDFRQMALAAINYESANQRFPFLEDTQSTLSWRVRLLPYLESNSIFDKVDLAKTAKEAPNSKFAKKMPKIFGPGGKTSGVSWIKSTVNGFANITDGSSNTIMLIENPKGGPWLEDNPLSIDDAVKLVTGLADGKQLIVAFYDGSCSKISNSVPEKDLRALFDPQDGNVVDDSWRGN